MGASSRGTRCNDESSGRTPLRSAGCHDASESHTAPDREASAAIHLLETRRRSGSVEHWAGVTCGARKPTMCHSTTTEEIEGFSAAAVWRGSFCDEAAGDRVENLHSRPGVIMGSLLRGHATDRPRRWQEPRRRDRRARSGRESRRLPDHAGVDVSDAFQTGRTPRARWSAGYPPTRGRRSWPLIRDRVPGL